MAADPNTLAEPLRTATLQLLAEANTGAQRVVVVSARRTYAEQVELRKKNCGTTNADIYEKPSGDCRPETARPGESKHERGLAVDFGGDLSLVAKLAATHGLAAPIAGEAWHYELAGAPSSAADGEGTPSPSSASSSGGLLSKIPIVGGALGGVSSLAGAAATIVAFVTDPKTWLRVLAVLAGAVLLVAGFALLGFDMLPRGAATGAMAAAA